MRRPEHAFMGMVRIGPKGQIVIPKEVRDMFYLEPGDSLVLLADRRRGIALHRTRFFERIVDAVLDGQAAEALPEETEENAQAFAAKLRELLGEDEA